MAIAAVPSQHLAICRRRLGSSFSTGVALAFAAGAMLSPVDPLSAHGFAGKRFFPASLAVEDPFVADELALPTISSRKVPARAIPAPFAKTLIRSISRSGSPTTSGSA